MLLCTVMSDAMGDADRDLALLLVGPVGWFFFFFNLDFLSLGWRDTIFQCS